MDVYISKINFGYKQIIFRCFRDKMGLVFFKYLNRCCYY